MRKEIFREISESADATEAVGRRLADLINENAELPRFVALYGDLGAGKTAFTRGFASVGAPGVAVKSPTYTIMNVYASGKNKIYHFDMYRITDDDDLYSIGYYDCIEDGSLCITEWSELVEYALPDERIDVHIDYARDENGIFINNTRMIRVDVLKSEEE